MDFSKAITYVLDDRRWLTKIGIGALIALVPILNFSLAGYSVEIIRRLMRSESEVLPEWDDLGNYFIDGLKLWVIGLVYSLPFLVLICLLLLPILPQLLPDAVDEKARHFLSGFGLLTMICGGLLLLMYSLFLSFLHPVIVGQYASQNSIGACFRVGEIWKVITKDIGGYLTMWLGLLALAFGGAIVLLVVAIVLNIIPCIGQVLAPIAELLLASYLVFASAHLVGQFAVENMRAGQA